MRARCTPGDRGAGAPQWFAVITAVLLAGCATAETPARVTPAEGGPTGSPSSLVTPTQAAMPIAPTPMPSSLPVAEPTSQLTAEPTLEPTSEPTPELTPVPHIKDRPGPLRVDGFANVLVTDLAIRSKPSVGTDSQVLGRLGSGDRLFILEGPVEDSGFAWYRVRQPADYPSTAAPPIGWVATSSRSGEAWLEGREPICPALPIDVGTLEAMSRLERLACFDSRPLTFVTTTGIFDALYGPVIPWGTPEWLNDPKDGVTFGGSMEIKVALSPGINVRWLGWTRIAGHFDDPVSSTCRGGYDNQETGERHEDPVDGQVLDCRLRFVVTDWIALHQVEVGDTLSGIADEQGVTQAALLAANAQVTDPSLIHPGDFLTIPSGDSTP